MPTPTANRPPSTVHRLLPTMEPAHDLIDRLPLINAGAMLDCVLSAYSVMARVAAHRMNVEWAHALLESAENQGSTPDHTCKTRGNSCQRENAPYGVFC